MSAPPVRGKWTRDLIIKTVRHLHARGDVSYNEMARRNQALLSAAIYHFGSYRAAVEKAKIDYAALMRMPRWTREKVRRVIRRSGRDGLDLSWRAATLAGGDLSQAAMAAVKPHLFGSWNAALAAAGLDPDAVSRYRHWDRKSIVRAIAARQKAGEPVNSKAVQREIGGLYNAGVRLFGSYTHALRAAGVKPETVFQRRTWDRSSALAAAKGFVGHHGRLSEPLLRKNDPGLRRAIAVYLGGLPAAREAVGSAGGRPVRSRGRGGRGLNDRKIGRPGGKRGEPVRSRAVA